jgi:hypothetical protein
MRLLGLGQQRIQSELLVKIAAVAVDLGFTPPTPPLHVVVPITSAWKFFWDLIKAEMVTKKGPDGPFII